jgi:O-antigen/teichoic acid export membrane protein
MSRSRAVLSGGAVMLLQVAVRMAGVLVVGHLLSKLAGGEMLGAYSAIWQLIWLVQLLELGVSQAISREVAQHWDRPGGEENRRRLPRASVGLLVVVGVTMSLALAVAAWSLPGWFRATPATRHAAAVAVGIAAVWMPFRFPLSFFSIFLFARQRLALYGMLSVCSEVVRVTLTIVAVWAGWGLPGMMAGTLAAEALNYGAAWWAGRRELPLRGLLGSAGWAEVWRLTRLGVPLGMISLGERLSLFSQELVVTAVAGARTASAFYATRMPGFLLSTVLGQLLYTLSPGLNDLYGRGLHEAFRRANLRLVSYASGVGLWAAAGIVVFTPALVSVWVGPRFFLGLPVTGAVAMLAVVSAFNNVTSQFAVVMGRVRVYTGLALGQGVLALLLSFFLGSRLGATSVMWAAAGAQCVSLPYLAGISGSLHGLGPFAYLRRVGAGALRCAGAGICASLLSLLLARAGVHVHPLVALPFAVAVGAVGFVQLGLFPEDRATVHAFIRRQILRRVAEQTV